MTLLIAFPLQVPSHHIRLTCHLNPFS
jgi:hypothetical protein